MEILSRVGAVLVALAPLVAIIIAVLTLRQLKAQTNAAYKPQLVLEEFLAKIHGRSESEEVVFPADWIRISSDGASAIQPDLVFSKPQFPLFLHNVGLGAAVSASLEWSFDVKLYMAQVNERMLGIAESQRLDVLLREGIFIAQPANGISDFRARVFSLENDLTNRIHAILPTSQVPTAYVINMPGSYVILLAGYLHTMHLGNREHNFVLPYLDLLVRYEDIARNEHQIAFHIAAELTGDTGSTWLVRFDVSVKI